MENGLWETPQTFTRSFNQKGTLEELRTMRIDFFNVDFVKIERRLASKSLLPSLFENTIEKARTELSFVKITAST